MGLLEWPDIIPGRIWWPDRNFSKQRKPPEGIVIHSGDKGPDLAMAASKMDISYHFAHSVKHGLLVQMVRCTDRAYHAGPEGNDWLGIAITGPDEQEWRPRSEMHDFQLLIEQLQRAFAGTLKYWCRHSDINPGKTDPGPGFDETWMSDSEMIWKRGPHG